MGSTNVFCVSCICFTSCVLCLICFLAAVVHACVQPVHAGPGPAGHQMRHEPGCWSCNGHCWQRRQGGLCWRCWCRQGRSQGVGVRSSGSQSGCHASKAHRHRSDQLWSWHVLLVLPCRFPDLVFWILLSFAVMTGPLELHPDARECTPEVNAVPSLFIACAACCQTLPLCPLNLAVCCASGSIDVVDGQVRFGAAILRATFLEHEVWF